MESASGSKGALRAFARVATAGDSMTTVTVPFSAGAKYSMSVVAYRGVGSVGPATFAVDTSSSATRRTPVVPVDQQGSWVLSYWMHRDSDTVELTPSPGVVVRASSTTSGGGRPTALVADSGGPAADPYGGRAATAAAASTFGITGSVVLVPD